MTSPTSPPHTERRESPRYNNSEQAIRCYIKSDRIRDNGSSCELVDISHTGFGIESLDKLPPGEDIKLDIEYRGKRLSDADCLRGLLSLRRRPLPHRPGAEFQNRGHAGPRRLQLFERYSE